MALATLKPILPRNLFGRALLILVVPVIGIQIVVAAVFIERHFAGISEQMTSPVAEQVRYAIALTNQAPSLAAAEDELAALAAPLGLSFTIEADGRVIPAEARRYFDVSGGAAAETFRRLIAEPIALDFASDTKRVELRVPTDKGVLVADIPRRRMIASNPHFLLVWMAVSSLALLAVAILFLRNQVRPIGRLAQAAEAFGKGRSDRFRPAGAEEVRRAGAAFLSMRARIERQIEQRTQMLLGVSHDLRTPLTRMKLTLAMADGADGNDVSDMVDGLSRDVEAMERVAEGFLAFGRDQAADEFETIDAVALAEEIVEGACRGGAEVELTVQQTAETDRRVRVRKGAVARALQNLVENAAEHGEHVQLTVRLTGKTLEYVVEDDGPGIAADDREAALQPFHRLDSARNQNRSAGVGLGLAITLDAARSHGGALELGDSVLGGLRVTLRLPR
ncbi:MAG: ATP-binding protein [Pseudomonadota bacterium]